MSKDTTTNQLSAGDLLVKNQHMFKNPGENMLQGNLAIQFGSTIHKNSIVLSNFSHYDGQEVPMGNDDFVPGENNPQNIGTRKLQLHEIGLNCSHATEVTMEDMKRFAARLANRLDNFVLNHEVTGIINTIVNPVASTQEDFLATLQQQLNAFRADGHGNICVLLNPSIYGMAHNHEHTFTIDGNVLFYGAKLICAQNMGQENAALIIDGNAMSFAFPREFKVTTTVNTTTMSTFFSVTTHIGINSNPEAIRLINLQAE